MIFRNFVSLHKYRWGDFVFYDRFLALCARKGVSPTRAAIDAGFSKSLVSKWKANGEKEPSPEVVRKLAAYFGVSKFEVLEDREPEPVGLDDFTYAMHSAARDLTEADKQLLLEMAQRLRRMNE